MDPQFLEHGTLWLPEPTYMTSLSMAPKMDAAKYAKQ